MSATKAQKFRLGLFLMVSTTILVGTILVMLGTSILEERDEYYVRFSGSVGGLEPGSQVRLNGIRVGRVEGVGIDPDDPGLVRVTLSLQDETPVTEDTVATLNMQGITGLKYIELSGATKGSKRLEPGSEVKAGGSEIDLLTEKAVSITIKIEKLLDNLVDATSDENMEKITNILTEVEGGLRETRLLVADNRPHLTNILGNVSETSNQLPTLTQDVKDTLATVNSTVAAVGSWIDSRQVRKILDLVGEAMKSLKDRLSKEELGLVIENTNKLMTESGTLVTNANVTLLRLRDDLRRTLDELAESTENFAEFTQILVEDPAALISGRSDRERIVP